MRIRGTFKKLLESDVLLKVISRIAKIKSKFNLYLAAVTDSKLFQLVLEYKRPLAIFLYTIWLAGCGYWFYQLMIIDVTPKDNLGLVVNDSRDALAILFFGTIGAVFVLLLALFIIKFMYNLFHNGIETFFSVRWHSLVRPASYLLILCFAFLFTGTVKATGLTAYNQVAGLFHISKQHNIIIEKEVPDNLEKKLSELMKMIEKDRQE